MFGKPSHAPRSLKDPQGPYSGAFAKHVQFIRWQKSIMAVASFDAGTTEWALAHLLDLPLPFNGACASTRRSPRDRMTREVDMSPLVVDRLGPKETNR